MIDDQIREIKALVRRKGGGGGGAGAGHAGGGGLHSVRGPRPEGPTTPGPRPGTGGVGGVHGEPEPSGGATGHPSSPAVESPEPEGASEVTSYPAPGSSSAISKGGSSGIILEGGGTASSTSRGGGHSYQIATGPFLGRQAGGGNRTNVYGTCWYGSGYPYGGNGWWVSGRPLPYTFWPIYIYPGGAYGSSDYGPPYSLERPGGPMTAAVIVHPFYDVNETYRIVGDNSSVTSVLSSIAYACENFDFSTQTYPFDPDSQNNNIPAPEQVLQYYRAASFALALDVYNNTAALLSNAPSSNSTAPTSTAQTPLPTDLSNGFLACLNDTIGSELPLVDTPSHHLSGGAIGGIVTGSVIGAMLILLLAIFIVKKIRPGPSTEKSQGLKESVGLGWLRRRKEQPYITLGDKDVEEAFHYDETKL